MKVVIARLVMIVAFTGRRPNTRGYVYTQRLILDWFILISNFKRSYILRISLIIVRVQNPPIQFSIDTNDPLETLKDPNINIYRIIRDFLKKISILKKEK